MRGLFRNSNNSRLLLASASERRRQLLASLGLNFSVLKPIYEEEAPEKDETPEDYARRMAAAKANAGRSALDSRTAIIAADTVVYLDGLIMGKPADNPSALAMLKFLSGRAHQVYTAVHMILPERRELKYCEMTRVHFASWPDDVIARYVDIVQPLDRAGAYGIQDGGGFLVERLDGSYTNVLGLPLTRLAAILLENGLIEPGP